MYKISESPYVVESTTVMDPGFQVVDFGFPVLNSHSLQVELGFQTPIVKWDSGFLKLYSGFQSPVFLIHKKNFPDSEIQFRNPDSLIWSENDAR